MKIICEFTIPLMSDNRFLLIKLDLRQRYLSIDSVKPRIKTDTFKTIRNKAFHTVSNISFDKKN